MFIAHSLPAAAAGSPGRGNEPAAVDGFDANIACSLAKLSANRKGKCALAAWRAAVEDSNQIEIEVIRLSKIYAV